MWLTAGGGPCYVSGWLPYGVLLLLSLSLSVRLDCRLGRRPRCNTKGREGDAGSMRVVWKWRIERMRVGSKVIVDSIQGGGEGEKSGMKRMHQDWI